MLLVLGTTTYGSCAAFSGESPLVWQKVSAWKQQSVSSLHCVVRTPSQSMSMSAFQKTAPVFSQTATVAVLTSSSVLYLPLEIWLQVVTLASSSAAVGAPVPPFCVVPVTPALCPDSLFAPSTAATEYVCEELADRPLTVAVVPVGEATTDEPS